MHKLLWGTLLTVALVFAGFGHLEPVTAQGGELLPGQTVQGRLEGEPRNYTITLQTGQEVTIRLESAAFDTILSIQDSSGAELAYNDDGGQGTDSSLTFVAPVDGVYTVIVDAWSSASATGNYTLTIADATAPREAQSIVPGETIQGNLAGEPDTYSIPLGAGEQVTIRAESVEFDTILSIRNSSGAELAHNDDGGQGTDSLLTFTAAGAGTYTVVVESYSQSEASGAYTLSISDSIVSTSGDGRLIPGVMIQDALSGAPDTHTVTLSAGQIAHITVESEVFDTVLSIHDAAGTELAFNDDGGQGTDSALTFIVPEDATYTVTVDAFSASQSSGAYTLQLTELTPTVVEIGGAVTVAPGNLDAAYVMFEGTMGSLVNVYAVSSGDEDILINLRGTDATEIASDDDNGPGLNPYLRRVYLPSDGLYLVEVKPFSDTLTENTSVTVEATEHLYLNSTPQALSLDNDERDIEVYTVNATQGSVYRFVVSCDNESGVEFDLAEPGNAATSGFQTSNALGISWDYLAPTTGLYRLSVKPSFANTNDTCMLSVKNVE